MTKRILIVDGYNVIRSTIPYRDIAERVDMETARNTLMNDVASYAHGTWRATVVFDGGRNAESTGDPHDYAGVTLIFSPYGVSADSVIETLARTAREAGDIVEVVTSDAQTQWAVMGASVSRRSSGEFAAELRDAEGDRRTGFQATGRVPIEDRIDEDVRRVLERWARGEA